MLKYIFKISLLSLLFFSLGKGALAQYSSDELYGIRIGTDLSRIPLHFINPYRTDASAHVDIQLDTNLYVVGEIGWNSTDFNNDPAFSYKSNGAFLRVGADYNLLKPSFPFESNMVFIGLRYGIAQMTRRVPHYLIEYPIWGDSEGSFSRKSIRPHWAEAVVGLKVELLNNFFVDWGLHLKFLVNGNVDKEVRPYIIPGFGKAKSNAAFDMNYSVSYRIPLWKPKPKKESKRKKKRREKFHF